MRRKTREAPKKVLQALSSGDWKTVRRGVASAQEILRSGNPSAATVADFEDALVGAAGHGKWEVREAVAHALPALRKEAFLRIVARLADDESDVVKRVVERAKGRRTATQDSDFLRGQRRGHLVGTLRPLESRFGRPARELAREAAEKYATWILGEVQHETGRVTTALDLSLKSLRSGLGESLDGEARHDLGVAFTCVRLLKGINDSLRSFTEPVTTLYNPEDIVSCLQEALSVLRANLRLDEEAFPIELKCPTKLPLVECHRARLHQALLNVLQNAYEAFEGTGRAPAVWIAVTLEDAERLRIDVRDAGKGMSEEAVDNALQLFGSSKAQGRGFGLPTAMKIVEAEHHGTIDIRSTKHEGTTVSIVLPVEQEDAR